MAKRKFLNVKTHLEHIEETLLGLEKYGYVPIIIHELHIIKLINRGILKAHDKKKTRKDIWL